MSHIEGQVRVLFSGHVFFNRWRIASFVLLGCAAILLFCNAVLGVMARDLLRGASMYQGVLTVNGSLVLTYQAEAINDAAYWVTCTAIPILVISVFCFIMAEREMRALLRNPSNVSTLNPQQVKQAIIALADHMTRTANDLSTMQEGYKSAKTQNEEMQELLRMTEAQSAAIRGQIVAPLSRFNWRDALAIAFFLTTLALAIPALV